MNGAASAYGPSPHRCVAEVKQFDLTDCAGRLWAISWTFEPIRGQPGRVARTQDLRLQRFYPHGPYRARTCDFFLVREALWPTELTALIRLSSVRSGTAGVYRIDTVESPLSRSGSSDGLGFEAIELAAGVVHEKRGSEAGDDCIGRSRGGGGEEGEAGA